jgi:DNA-binding LacI/PurR family transcriptional regulator
MLDGTKMTITIRDVAREAGTSTATVSHVLNSTGRITAETRRRVLAVMKRLKYYPNLHARNLAFGSSRTLGMIVSDIENPFFPAVIRAFEVRARHRGYEVIVSNTNYEPSLMKRAAERMLEQKVRGVAIMTSEMSANLVEELLGREIAVTFFDAGVAHRYVSTVKMDYLSGVRQAVEHLYQFGHCRIAFVAGRSAFRNIKARQVAYVDCMGALGLAPGPIVPGNQRFDGGLAAGHAIARMNPRPTAVIAMNDLTAVGVIKALHQEGLRVPQDVSVVGFDRTHLAECFIPSLTTVDMHPDLLGRTAADALHELCASEKGKEHFISLQLVIGESTGPAPKDADRCQQEAIPAKNSDISEDALSDPTHRLT